MDRDRKGIRSSAGSRSQPAFLGLLAKSKGARIRAAICVIVLLGAAASIAVWHSKRYHHFAVHEPEMIYRSAWLEPDALVCLIERYQIRTVLNLCHPGEMGEERWIAEREAVSGAGAHLLELPMPVGVQPEFDSRGLAPHLEALGNPDNYPMLVHCQHGVTRTAKLLMLYDMVHRRMSAQESLKAMPLFGRSQASVHVRAFARQLDVNRERVLSIATPDSLAILRQ